MADEQYPRRRTKPFPRAELAPIAPAPDTEREAETMFKCPVCAGMLTAEQYAELKYSHAVIHQHEHPAAVDDELPGPRDDETPPEGA